MTLAIEAEAQVTQHDCPHCGRQFQRVVGFIYKHGDAYAIYYASCYPHEGETWLDVIFSPTWSDGDDDRITFGCRTGMFGGADEPGAALVTAAAAYPHSDLFGRRLSPEEALVHPRLADFWEVIDHVLTNDSVVRKHVYGPDEVFDAE